MYGLYIEQLNSQSIPAGSGLLYPRQIGRLKRRGFTGEGAILIFHNNGKSLAVDVAESLTHVAGEGSVMMLREPADIPVIGLLLPFFFFPLVRDFYRADHYPFLSAAIPAIQITDSANFRNPNYHKATDTPDTLDYEFLAKIVAAIAITVMRLDKAAAKPK